MTRRTLNTAAAGTAPRDYDPVTVMNKYMYETPVRNGAVYLDMRYPGWARRVRSVMFDMRSRSYSVLALLHEIEEDMTPEWMHWSDSSLIAHGFMPRTNDDMEAHYLTLQWFIAIEDRLNPVGK